MNKYIYSVALAATLAFSGGVYALGNTDQDQGQGQAQGQTANAGAVGIGVGEGGSATAGAIGLGGKQAQGQSSKNVNRNVANGGAGGTASAGAASGSSSGASSRVGDTSSFSEGSRAASGAISGANSGGNDTAQDVSLDASDNSVQNLTYKGDEFPVSTAASLFTQVCQQGVSGQGDDWGASAVFSDPLCDEIKVAQFYWIAHINEHNHGNDEQAAEFKTMYVAQMADIQKMMDATDELGIIDRISGFLLKPLGVAALLVFLL